MEVIVEVVKAIVMGEISDRRLLGVVGPESSVPPDNYVVVPSIGRWVVLDPMFAVCGDSLGGGHDFTIVEE